MMTTYGYIRKGFPFNETDQVKLIMAYNCDSLFFEGARLNDTTELEVILASLQPADCLVVPSLQVFGKDLQHLVPLIAQFKEQEIHLVSIKDQLDTERDRFFYPFFEVIASIDGACKAEYHNQRLNLTRESHKNMGRPTLEETTIERIYQLYHESKWSMRRIALECDVSLGSVYKYTQAKTEGVL